MASPALQPTSATVRRSLLPGVVLTEGIHRMGSTLPWHFHGGASMCLVLDGAFTEYSRGVALDCRASTLKFTPPGERHWNRFDVADVRGLLVEIDLAGHASIAPFEPALSRSRQFDRGPEVQLARRLYAEFRRTDAAAILTVEGLLLELLARVAGGGDTFPNQGAPAWARRAYELVEAGYAETLSLASIALEVGVHPATLARGFRHAYGCSIGEMQRELRLDFSARQLALTDLTLARIAEQAGFFDQSHFSNAFRRRFGTTPRHYRRANRTSR